VDFAKEAQTDASGRHICDLWLPLPEDMRQIYFLRVVYHPGESDRMLAAKQKGHFMKQTQPPTEAGLQYAEAYEAHYNSKNMHNAFLLYNRVIAAHPESRGAEYSRSQLQNILKAVVPKQKIAEFMQQLMVEHFEQTAAPGSAAQSMK
jgi:hypothetical protein